MAKKPRLDPALSVPRWSDDDVAAAQRVVDMWIAGAKLREIDETGVELGSAATVLGRLRKNGLNVPARARGRGAGWVDEVPEVLVVEPAHLGQKAGPRRPRSVPSTSIAFTGYSPARHEFERIAFEAGWSVRSVVSKRTLFLVVCDPALIGRKRRAAEELGVVCLTPQEFLVRASSQASFVASESS